MTRIFRSLVDLNGRSPHERDVMTDSLAFVFIAGPSLALAWVALPHPAVADEAGIVALCAGAWACAAALLVLPAERISEGALQAILFLGTALISAAIYFTGVRYSGFELFYLWTTPYAYFFFGARQAALQTAWVGACFAAVLPSLDGQVGDWLITIGTVIVVGVLVRRLGKWMHASEVRFRRGFDDSPLGMALIDTDLRYREANDALCRMLGRSREEIVGAHVNEVTHPDDVDVSPDLAEALRAGGDEEGAFEKRMLRADGSAIVVAGKTALIDDPAGRPQYFFTQIEDVTERRRNERELAVRARQQETVARLGQVALRSGDLNRLMDEVVAAVATTLDVERCKILELDPGGEELHALAAVPHAREALASDRPVVVEDSEDGGVSGVSVVIGGRERPFGVLGAHTTRKRAFSGDDVNFVQAAANLLSLAVERHRIDEANRHAALHDALTGLPNRSLLLDRIAHALERRDREGTTVAVFALDLDRFKLINDSLGHARGDALLFALAPRLRAAVRPHDTVARLGGDEFVVLCESLEGPDEAQAIAERIAQAVAEPFTLARGEHAVSASIGIAIASCPDATPTTLLRDADIAMYRAKDLGRGRAEFFDEEMRDHLLRRVQTERELRRAIENDELRLHYQPVFDLESCEPLGVEALVRWEHPERGLVPPDLFIPIAEETGLIADLGLWVLDRACRHVAAWQRELAGDLELWVNVSGKQLAHPGFPARVAETARRAGLAAGTLGLEITETVFVEEAESPTAVLSTLREDGVRLALDDFGTGYSSLSSLKHFDLDILKVDRSFVAGLGTNRDDSTIVAAIVKMAQTLGLDVVAEGVETAEQLEDLRELGCTQAQGYLLARPLPAEALREYLTESLGTAMQAAPR